MRKCRSPREETCNITGVALIYIYNIPVGWIIFLLRWKRYNYFRNKRGFNKRILSSLFSSIILPFHNPAVYGSKLPYLRVESMALLGAKPHGFGWEMRAERWMISPSRLRNTAESTRWRRGVDSYTLNQSTRRRIWLDSAERSSRLEITRIASRGK